MSVYYENPGKREFERSGGFGMVSPVSYTHLDVYKRQEYAQMGRQIPDNKVHIFPTGGHPAIATNAELAAKIICDFIEE